MREPLPLKRTRFCAVTPQVSTCTKSGAAPFTGGETARRKDALYFVPPLAALNSCKRIPVAIRPTSCTVFIGYLQRAAAQWGRLCCAPSSTLCVPLRINPHHQCG